MSFCTANLQMLHIIYYSTNIRTEYFKHAAHSPFFSLQNAVYFIMLPFLVSVLFTFYIQGVPKFKKKFCLQRVNTGKDDLDLWHDIKNDPTQLFTFAEVRRWRLTPQELAVLLITKVQHQNLLTQSHVILRFICCVIWRHGSLSSAPRFNRLVSPFTYGLQ